MIASSRLGCWRVCKTALQIFSSAFSRASVSQVDVAQSPVTAPRTDPKRTTGSTTAQQGGVREATDKLKTALLEGRPTEVPALINAGADVNARYPNGSTLLMGAAVKGYVEAVRALIDAGADVNAKGPSGATALEWAKKYPEIVRIIQQAQTK